jgi:hypothetical protein
VAVAYRMVGADARRRSPTLAAAAAAADARGDHEAVKWLVDEYGWYRGVHEVVAARYLARLEPRGGSPIEAEILIETHNGLEASDRRRLRTLIPTWHTLTERADGLRFVHDRAWRMFDADDLATTLVDLLTDSSTPPSDALIAAVRDRVRDVSEPAQERLRAVLATDGLLERSSAVLRDLASKLERD